MTVWVLATIVILCGKAGFLLLFWLSGSDEQVHPIYRESEVSPGNAIEHTTKDAARRNKRTAA
jgi:hypothetical protein